VARLWQLLDLITPMAIRVVATLRIPDLIAEGVLTPSALAARTGADPDALRRVLRYLAARGIFEERPAGQLALTELSRVLLDDHPTASRSWIDLDGFGGTMDRACFDLLAAVKRPPVAERARPADAVASSYDSVMEAQSRTQAPAIVAAFDWSGVNHVVDLGGGTGTLLIELLRDRRDIGGTLVELPTAAERARANVALAGLVDRCEVLTGDLFEVTPAGADVYVLKLVLHALDDAHATRALRLCREAGAPGARVLVIERTVEPGDDRSQFTAMDLRMLVLGHGRERTLDEFAELAGKAGFRLAAAQPTSVGLHLITLVPQP
jgi:hypothetical protein